MNYVSIIDETLRKTFEPVFLEVVDESELHRGHVGFKDGTQTHFKVVLAQKFLKKCLGYLEKELFIRL